MADATGPVLLVVGGDPKRLQWLTHHVTSHWPDAQVTGTPDHHPPSLTRLLRERTADAVILQIDFGEEGPTSAGLGSLQLLQDAQPGVYCIVLAEHGDELSAVRAMKYGAKDYLPLGRITRDTLLRAVSEAQERQRSSVLSAATLLAPASDTPNVKVPGYSIVKEISTTNFSSVFLARSERLRRNVVLKVMNRGTSPREMDDAERFQREYEIISSIAHRPSRKFTISERCRITSIWPWNTFPAATCATGCATP